MTLNDSITAADPAALAAAIRALPPVWGDRLRECFLAALQHPHAAATAALATWRATEDAFVRAHCLVILTRGLFHCHQARAATGLSAFLSKPAAPSDSVVGDAFNVLAEALRSPMHCHLAARFMALLFPLNPQRYAAVFGALDGALQNQCASALVYAARKHRLALCTAPLFEQWLAAHPDAAMLFLHHAPTATVTAFLKSDAVGEHRWRLKWPALWRHHQLDGHVWDVMAADTVPDAPSIVDAALRLRKVPATSLTVRPAQIKTLDDARFVFAHATFVLKRATTLRDYMRLTDMVADARIPPTEAARDALWAPPKGLEGFQRTDFVRAAYLLYRTLGRPVVPALPALVRTVASWVNPTALELALAAAASSPMDKAAFFVTPAAPAVVAEWTLDNYARCCLTTLAFFTAHARDATPNHLAPVLDFCAAHPESAHTAAVVEGMCRMLTADGAEWLLYPGSTDGAFCRAVARHLPCLRVSRAAHVMLSEHAPHEYYNHPGTPGPCPDLRHVVYANLQAKRAEYAAGTVEQRLIFLQTHTLGCPEFGDLLMDTLRRCRDVARFALALLCFVRLCPAPMWRAVMAPLLPTLARDKGVTHNIAVADGVDRWVPALPGDAAWATPFFAMADAAPDRALFRAMMPKFDAAELRAHLPECLRAPQLVWPYEPTDLATADTLADVTPAHAALWGARFSEYVHAYWQRCLELREHPHFPWVTAVTDATLLNRIAVQYAPAVDRYIVCLAARGVVAAPMPSVPWGKLVKMPLAVMEAQVAQRGAPEPRMCLDDCIPLHLGSARQTEDAVCNLVRFLHVDPQRCIDELCRVLCVVTDAELRCYILHALVDDARVGVWAVPVDLTETDKAFLAVQYMEYRGREPFAVDLDAGTEDWALCRARVDDAAFGEFLFRAAHTGVEMTVLKLLHAAWVLDAEAPAKADAALAMKTVKRLMRLDHLRDNVAGLGTSPQLWEPVYSELTRSLAGFVRRRLWPVDAASAAFVRDAATAVAAFAVTDPLHYQAAVALLECLTFVQHVQRAGLRPRSEHRGHTGGVALG